MIKKFEKSSSYTEYLKNLITAIFTMSFLSFYTTIDGFFVSRFVNSDALAAINIVVPITCIIFGVSVMFATGAGAFIGEKLGQKKTKEASEIFSFICIVLLIFSVIFSIFGIVFVKQISLIMGATPKLIGYVIPYAVMVFLGTIPMSFKLFFEYIVRNDGNSKIGLIMSFAGLILNIILDYIFVNFFNLGILGTGLGTFWAISISAMVGLIYFLKYSNIKFCKPKLNFKIFIKSCTNGSSELLTELSTGIITFLFNMITVKYFGEDGIAAVTIIMYVYYFFSSFHVGIAVGTAPIISYCVGSKNYNKIKETLKYSFITIIITSVIMACVSYFGANNITNIFISDNNVFNITLYGLKVFSLVFLFIGINVFLSSYFTALGNGLISAVISSLRSLILVILFILILPRILGVTGIWLTMPLAEACTIIVALILYFKFGNNYTKNNIN